MLADDDDESTGTSGPSHAQSSQQPAWMRNLLERCREWLAQVPAVGPPWSKYSNINSSLLQTFSTLDKPSNDNQDPLYRLFYREGMIGQKLLVQVRKDLSDVVKVCEGGLKQTNHLRKLMSSLTKGTFLSISSILLQY
jgi:dynein heavy chain 1, cytosolic